MAERERDTPSEATVFEILSSPRRRYVLYVLDDRKGTVALNEVAGQIAAWENGVSVEAVTSQQRKRVYVSLYQTHVPALTGVYAVDYDGETSELRNGECAAEFKRYLGIDASRRRWSRYYLGLAAAGVVLLGIVWATGAISMVVVAFVVVLAFATLAIADVRSAGRDLPLTPPDVARSD